jgi:hypothetical protein
MPAWVTVYGVVLISLHDALHDYPFYSGERVISFSFRPVGFISPKYAFFS